jgi:hypothetical protein
MSKKTSTLDDLKVKSFVTKLEPEQMNQVKGGYYTVKGRRFTYRTRWTAVDIRSNADENLQRGN